MKEAKKQKFKKLLLLQKDWQEDSNFRIISDEFWKEIEFNAIPIFLERIKTTKDKYIYSISIPLAPGHYSKFGEINIPIELNEEFLDIFQDDIDKIQKIEQILYIKSMRRIEKLVKETNKDTKND